MQVEIINIGDELLIGQVVNTNAARMGKALFEGGFTTRRMITISDHKEDIIASIDQRLPDTKVLIFSGGLGPTRDDLTKNVLAEYFGTELVLNQDAYNDIKSMFEKRGYELTETNKEQAYLPKDCTTLPNPVGSARGMWFEKDDLVVISLPGVPSELDVLMEQQVMPRIIKHFNTQPLHHITIMTAGIGESFLSDIITKWEDELPADIGVAYLPQYGSVRLRITCTDPNSEASQLKLEEQYNKVRPLIEEYIYGLNDITIQESIGDLLRDKGLTVATAESCSGGYISHLITSIAGSSSYYKGSIISYANDVKMQQLNVSQEDLETYGAVSEQVVKQMAEGARKALHTDCAIATSGIAGPTGGTTDKPVGTIWVAIATPDNVSTHCFNFGDKRMANIERTSLFALNLLRKQLINQ